ncbi:HTH-type transcriptional repressor CytR [Roseivivax sp. THAF40]|uniref:LacI family DNA-binding transcriptional regulator n=1 Tax=unclassified Roseivivax TaxID=2639302 RepID=UPI001269760E|nr:MULTISPECIES: LacI family DNA-binding transcriptional regulator [unclassified Roseivivax]QFS83578.1 HTH-type transcriptional repressor CytR [Roseivivax sp. THAF197b]QFT47325.1 HTH-type transcriptional repressor CytR [Roseivivax sp. THAF40]
MADQISKPEKRATIRTVAADAGVSVTAVSKVLNNAYGVSADMRAKVMNSVEKLGYRPSFAARGMRGATDTVGVLLVDMHNPFLADVVDGIKASLSAQGMRLMLSVGEAEMTVERSLIDGMIDMRMDGLILVAPRLSAEILAAYATQIPTVVIGHHEPSADRFDTVNCDDAQGARIAVRQLIATGRRDIWMLTAPSRAGGFEVFDLREKGYRDAMQEAGLEDHIRVIEARSITGEDTDTQLQMLRDLPKPGGIFCWSDIHAVPMLNTARKSGIRVPEDVAIVGFDNSTPAALPLVDLTSIDQHGFKLGQHAADALMSRIKGRAVAEHIDITPDLIRRSSA